VTRGAGLPDNLQAKFASLPSSVSALLSSVLNVGFSNSSAETQTTPQRLTEFYRTSAHLATQMPCLVMVNAPVCVRVCPCVRHTPVMYQNDASYDNEIFTVCSVKTFCFKIHKFFRNLKEVIPI